jgi:peptidoglycan hydrolase-like protein with peptidoglycan-binding domain
MPVLKSRSSGPDVQDLQQKLKDLGFDPNGVDGTFGPGTEKAVRAFQSAKGLAVDGQVGPNTMAALQSAFGAASGGGIFDAAEAGLGAVAVAAATTAATVAATTAAAADTISKILSEADYVAAAALLSCEIAAIKAVAEVESRGAGFLSDGRPKILFERHKFHKFTGGKFSAGHPGISNKSPGGYGAGGAHQWDRFNEAFALDPSAAVQSCSWGKFQVMGFNFEVCGFANIDDFRTAMETSEGEHLKAFCNFISGNKLAGALRNRQWATLASGYNGADYKINQYDTKLAAAYKKYSS